MKPNHLLIPHPIKSMVNLVPGLKPSYSIGLLFLFCCLAACDANNSTLSATYQPPFTPVEFQISSDGVTVKADLEIVTPLGTFGLEAVTDITAQSEDFLVIIEDQSRPDGQKFELFTVNLVDTEVEVIFDEQISIARLYITENGIWFKDTEEKLIEYHNKENWIRIDATAGKVKTVLLKPAEGFWGNSSYKPWQYFQKSEIIGEKAPRLLLNATLDLTSILLYFVPQCFWNAFGRGISVIVGWLFNALLLIGLLFLVFKHQKTSVVLAALFLFAWVFLIITGSLQHLLQ